MAAVFDIESWSKDCIILSKSKRDAVTATKLTDANVSNVFPQIDVSATNAIFKQQIQNCLYQFVTVSTLDDKKLLEQSKTGFERSIKWNKYRAEMSNQAKSNYWNYLIDPTFNKVNSLFLWSFENKKDIIFFSKYYTPKVEIKYFNG